jgi:hypothetical protein
MTCRVERFPGTPTGRLLPHGKAAVKACSSAVAHRSRRPGRHETSSCGERLRSGRVFPPAPGSGDRPAGARRPPESARTPRRFPSDHVRREVLRSIPNSVRTESAHARPDSVQTQWRRLRWTTAGRPSLGIAAREPVPWGRRRLHLRDDRRSRRCRGRTVGSSRVTTRERRPPRARTCHSRGSHVFPCHPEKRRSRRGDEGSAIRRPGGCDSSGRVALLTRPSRTRPRRPRSAPWRALPRT